MLPTPTTAAIYARISSDPEHTELGVTRQLQDCRELAVRHRLTISGEYVDDDRSAWSGKARPAYRELLDDIREGLVEAVLVWHADRLHRQPRELEEYIDICQPRAVSTYACVSGPVDLTNPDGRLVARMLGAVAAHESDSRSRRIRRKHEELALAGKPAGGGTRPYGYASDRRTVVQSEAAVIREAAARIAAGASLRSTATDLNQRGIRTVSGGEWSVQVLRRMLMSTRLSGQRSYQGEIVAEGDWEAILTPQQTSQLRAVLGDPARLTRRTVRRYLLAGGLLRCGRCDAVLVARPRADGERRYVCAKGPGKPGCGGTFILAAPLEAFIAEAVLHRLDTPELAAALAGRAHDDEVSTGLQTEIARDQAQLEELARAWGERQITMGEYLAARTPIETRIETARRSLARVTRSAAIDPWVGQASSLRTAWRDLPLTRQRAVIAAVLDRVTVGPGTRGRTAFDPARLEPLWRV